MSAGLFPRGVPMAKRGFDLVLTIPGLLLITPLLGALALMIRWRLGHPGSLRAEPPRAAGGGLQALQVPNDGRRAQY